MAFVSLSAAEDEAGFLEGIQQDRGAKAPRRGVAMDDLIENNGGHIEQLM